MVINRHLLQANPAPGEGCLNTAEEVGDVADKESMYIINSNVYMMLKAGVGNCIVD